MPCNACFCNKKSLGLKSQCYELSLIDLYNLVQ